ncbi:hypothetical protein FS847_12920 [Streptomyces sp. ISID311]|nr:hypothetical protein FS847_12920 [Streptomyces sp. ISID311]
MDQAGSGSGVWCRASQGGGGSQGGALATDRCGARPREPGMIQTTAASLPGAELSRVREMPVHRRAGGSRSPRGPGPGRGSSPEVAMPQWHSGAPLPERKTARSGR